jgi:ABC-type phosphate transport system substrate-binding protein
VVSTSNPITSIKRRELARMFMKKVTRWQDGSSVTPVDQSANSPIRTSFTRDVMRTEGLGQLSSIVAYWQQQIYSGTGSPPEVKDSDADVVAFVAAKRGGVGYVSAAANLNGVKAVKIEDQ